MKIYWIVILYHTPHTEQLRLQNEMKNQGSIIFIDNTGTAKGYAEGVNEGIKQAQKERPDVCIILNPDVSIKSITTENIKEVTQHFDVVGFAMRQNGKIYYGGELDKWRMSGGLISVKPSQQFTECDFVSGSLMIITKEVIEKIGLFDESYGMYYEDVDYCIRAQRAGLKVGIDTEVEYDHFETSHTNPRKNEYLRKNRLKILMKYGSWKQKLYELVRLPKTFVEKLIPNH